MAPGFMPGAFYCAIVKVRTIIYTKTVGCGVTKVLIFNNAE